MKKLIFSLTIILGSILLFASNPKYLYINGFFISTEEIDSITVDIQPIIIDTNIPFLTPPPTGKTTVVLYVPKDTPEGCYAVGTVNGWNHYDTSLKFIPIKETTDNRWVYYTFDYSSDMEIKVIAIPSDPEIIPDWSYQWGKNMDLENNLEEDNITILQGKGELILENGGQPKLISLVDGGVVYIQVKAWDTTPIVNITPAGNNTFTIHIDENSYVAENATFSIAGNFQEESWNNSRIMTEVEKGKKYTWTGNYPKNFEFKIIQTIDGVNIWSEGSNIKFNGTTFEYTVYFNTPFDY